MTKAQRKDLHKRILKIISDDMKEEHSWDRETRSYYSKLLSWFLDGAFDTASDTDFLMNLWDALGCYKNRDAELDCIYLCVSGMIWIISGEH